MSANKTGIETRLTPRSIPPRCKSKDFKRANQTQKVTNQMKQRIMSLR